jgi:hypothetical protein
MANQSVRRTLSRASLAAQRNADTVQRPNGSVTNVSGSVADNDRSTDTDDRGVDVQSVSAERNRVGVVEIDPGTLTEFINRDAAEPDTGTDSRRGRRTRSDSGKPRGTGRRKKEAPQNIEALVTMAHTWGAVLLKCPELMIEAEEAQKLSTAYEEFARHHKVPIINEKTLSEINLLAALLIIEGTRFTAIVKRKKDEREQKQQHQPAPFPINARVAH